MKNKLFSLLVTAILMMFVAGCELPNSADVPVHEDILLEKGIISNSVESNATNALLNKELALARASTARYHNINNALADGYIDIGVYIPQMGWHFLNPALVDENFDIDKPELLVYANKPDGGYKLVAIEYGTPLSLPAPPEGFTGDGDEWHANTDAGLWTLHAWVWLHNPNGVFASFNPRVP